MIRRIAPVKFLAWLKQAPDGPLALIAADADQLVRDLLEPLATALGPEAIAYVHGGNSCRLLDRRAHIITIRSGRAEERLRGAQFAGAYIADGARLPRGFPAQLQSRLVPGAQIQ